MQIAPVIAKLCVVGLVTVAPLAVQFGQVSSNAVSAGTGVVDAGAPKLAPASFDPPVAVQLLKAQAGLVQEAESTYRGARQVEALPGWSRALKDVERSTRLNWRGLPAAIVIVPDGGRGFACDGPRSTCLGRYQGVTMLVQQGADSGSTTMLSVILVAESAKSRPEVWMHELTHALLSQHGKVAESQRHDRRYFAEEQFVRVEF
jgi:hypothetical protein